MTDGQHTRNAITGGLIGSVVQAGVVGQVILPAFAAHRPVPRQLPPGLPDFTGRVELLAALDALLPGAGHAAVAVVHGTGGAGKTSLAVQWAHRVEDRFPDGTLFADLRGYGPTTPLSPAIVLTSFLSALGVPGSAVPARVEEQSALYRSVLAGRRALVVLDNALDAGQVQPLLPGAPGCLTVVTSRGALTELIVSRAARPVELTPFSGAQALALVRGLIGPGRADAEPEAVSALVRVCGGLPLAVRIAATRAVARPRSSLAEVVADLTADHPPDLANALRSVFGWSYARLPAAPARVFRHLGLHPGTEFGVAAVSALTALAQATAYDSLEALADLHLVEPIGRRRYRIHDLLHTYAAERAEEDDDPGVRRAAVGRVLAWYAGAVQRADSAAFPALAGVTPAAISAPGALPVFRGRSDALAWLCAEQVTVIAAVRRAAVDDRHELVMVLAAGSRFLSWQGPGLSGVCLELLSLGLTAARATGDRAVESLFHVLRGETLWSLGRLAEAEAAYTAALSLAGVLHDPVRRVDGLAGLGGVRLAQGRLREARKYYSAALPLASGLSGGRTEAVVHGQLSRIHTRLGEFPEALEHAGRELALRQRARDEPGEAYALHTAALARQGMGEHTAAIRLCRQAIARHRALEDIGTDLAETLLTLAGSLERTGQDEQSAACRQEASAVLTLLGDPRAEEVRCRDG